jgi:hypothetical protein
MDLFNALHAFQCLTKEDIHKLLFSECSKKNCERRLCKLAEASYLERLKIPNVNPGRAPFLYYLGPKAEIYGFAGTKPRLTRQWTHQMKNSRLMIEFIISAREAGIDCEILPEHLIRASSQMIIPDGAILLKRESRSALFLIENCAGTEIIKSDSFHEDEFYEDFFERKLERFRVLYIANNQYRLNSIAEVAKRYNEHGFIWFATMNEFLRKGVAGKIWTVPTKEKTEFNQGIIK